MKPAFVCIVVLIVFFPLCVSAAWVEFKPGACSVGPPPNCVAGHWYWIAPGGGSSGLGGISAAQAQSFNGQHFDEHAREERPSEVSCMIEHEEYELSDSSGNATAFSAGYQYSTNSGNAFGIFASYDRSRLAGYSGDTSVLVGSLYAQLYSTEFSRTSFSLTYSDVTTPGVEKTGSYGGGFNYTYNRFWKHASFLIGFGLEVAQAILPEAADGSEQADLGGAASFGLGFGIMPTRRLSMSFEAFSTLGVDLKGLEDSMTEETDSTSTEENDYQVIHVGGFYLNYLFTDFWGMTLGYKKMFGLETYDGNEFSIGSSFRF